MKENTKYQDVEAHIRQLIHTGTLVEHDKLPSIRHLSQQQQVSRNTVIRAYQELEAAGIVYPVPRSGYCIQQKPLPEFTLVSDPNHVDLLSVTKSILAQPLIEHTMPAGSAHPNIDGPAIRSLYAEIGRHSRYQTQIPSHYQLPPGNSTLIKQLIKITQDCGITAHSNEISITHGAQQAISLALRALTKPGDIVIVESPCYFGNLLLMESLDLQVIEIPSSIDSGIDIKALKEAISLWDIAAILVTPNFNNPTGSRMPLAARQALLDESQNIPIIEDDVFGALSFDAPLPSLKSLDKGNRVIYCNSLSKTLDSRLRVGWILAGQYQRKIEKYLISDNMGSLNLMQSALGEFLTTGKYRQHLSKMKKHYHSNQKRFSTQLIKALNQHDNLRGQFQLSRPQGAFLSWLILPPAVDSYAIYQECLKAKVSVLPGTIFGTHDQYKHCIRFSCASYQDNDKWAEGVERFANIVATHLTEQG
ncbi:PLP-dependent aminotransferase family protein [Vibrio genomosp. F6]|uniref:Transcriptional regulator n=1 Tax=Vibrio genomosp. F6 str. FF-238 TaxID=1191298 RepID=A0A1E5D0H1_9VIBR|nr:PLP-dependent aminotransferase family protein [Vibrio genomosp. F6]OEE76842.1 transcriptional regulator [Vibrio genomosp. F6 str. FF-238]